MRPPAELRTGPRIKTMLQEKIDELSGGAGIRRIRPWHYIVIAAVLAVLYLLENAQTLGISGSLGYYFLYAAKNTAWLVLGAVILTFPAAGAAGLIRLRGTVALLALIFAILYLLLDIALGIFTAFAGNTYSLTPGGIALNLISAAAVLTGGELCRAFLIGHLSGRKPYRAIIGIGLLFAAIEIPLGTVLNPGGRLETLDFLSDVFFKQAILSISASCLAYLAGPLPPIVYLGVIRAFGYLSPYVPAPGLIPRLLFNVFVPLVSVLFILKTYAREAAEYDKREQKDGITPGWIATVAASVLIVWFAVGIFPIFPSVILTGSMEPGIMPGDIVIVEKSGCGSVAVGDVIMFSNGEGMNITHRVIEKTEADGEVLFRTKGDNNAGADAGYVSASQLRGRVIAVVPVLGYPALMLRRVLSK
jgi:signal peptidase